MLIKVPPAFSKTWRDVFNYSPIDFIYWRIILSENNTATLNQLEERIVLVEKDNNDKRKIDSICVTKRTGIYRVVMLKPL
ncbi:MAG: hypothetical protein H6Q12_940 [Bacteroidetes bacterium]|nr:hypothetical protein [Bacteroidota bacterium]